MLLQALAMLAHTLSAVIWIGGMFFAYVALRPSLASVDGSVRLAVWQGTFQRFFRWVWACIIILFVSGFILIEIHYGAWYQIPSFVQTMALIAAVMSVLFCYLYFMPYRVFTTALAQANQAPAAGALNQIRKIVLVNLVLGMCVVIVAIGGRYLTNL